MTTRPAITTAKQQLRLAVKKRVSSLPTDIVSAQSLICVNTLFSLPEYQSSQRISIFLSMPAKEIDTSRIVEDALSHEKQVYVPYIHKLPPTLPNMVGASTSSSSPSVMDMLSLVSHADYYSLEPDSWGIPSISNDSLPQRRNCLEHGGLDLIVMPGVAFDEGFRRLGHGKGYYDCFLAKNRQLTNSYQPEMERKAKLPILVALALKEQVFEDGIVPVDLNDWSMDVIITGDGRLLRR